MARVKACPLCGTRNPPDELFCSNCGTSLADVAAMEESELEGVDAEVAEEETEAGGDTTPNEGDVAPAETADTAPSHTVREVPTATCALLFPWGRVEVAGELPIGRETGFSPLGELASYNTVSRQHAVVSLADGQWTVRDLRSTNGTYLNGARLAEGETKPINDGDRIGFSQSLQAEVKISG